MNIKTLNQKIRTLALGEHQELVNFIKVNIENKLSEIDKLELYTIGSMYASSEGCVENLKFMVNKMPEILLEKEQGILRMTVDIKDFEKFKSTINFLLEYSDKLNFNIKENSWLKECIKNESLDKIEYIQEKIINLEINENVIKTLVRNKNKEIFNYFIFNLDIKINDKLENWLIENNHKEELEIIKKRYLFNNLDKELNIKKKYKDEKNMNHYDFKKLNKEEKFNERNKTWVSDNPELYIRFLIIDNEKEILTKIENENNLKFDFSYKTKNGILLTLALEKHAYDVIDLLIDKKLEIKESDMMYFIKNFRDKDTSKYYEILDNHLNKCNINNILKSLSDYYYDDSIEYFVNYLIDNQIKIEEEIKIELKEISNLSLIFKKEEVINNYKKLDDKLDTKQSSKKTKI